VIGMLHVGKHALLAGCALGLGLLAGCSGRELPETVPPRFVFYEPRQDTLFVSGGDTLHFLVQEGEDQAAAGDWEVTVDGHVVARANEFDFRPLTLLELLELDTDQFLPVRISLQQGEVVRYRQWWVKIQILDGVELLVSPAQRELITAAGLPVLFTMELRGAQEPVSYQYKRDGAVVSNQATYYYPADRIDTHQIIGRAFWGEGRSVQYNWEVTVLPGQDQTAPPPVDDLRAGPGPAPGQICAAFSPPDGGNASDLTVYEIRGFYYPLDSEEWETTFLLGLLPADPEVPQQRYLFSELQPGRTLYLRIKSYDNSGNGSAWSNLASDKVRGYPVRGRVIDFESGDPLPGMQVLYGNVPAITDAQGRFLCQNVEFKQASDDHPPGLIRDELEDGMGEWFDLHDPRVVEDSLNLEFGTFRVLPFESSFYANFLGFAAHLLDIQRWQGYALHPRFPITTYFEDYAHEGVQYSPLVRNAMAAWEEDTGIDLFIETADSAQAAMKIIYVLEPNFSGSLTVLQREGGTQVPVKMLLAISGLASPGSEASVQRVILHELGHALGMMNHSNDPDHVMSIFNEKDRPTSDEIRLVRAIVHMRTREYLPFISAD
jgi:hypothetical protein